MVLYIDSLRRVIIEEGSLDDKKVGEIKNYTSFLKWFHGWLPSEWIKKIGKNEDLEQEDHDKGENNPEEEDEISELMEDAGDDY